MLSATLSKAGVGLAVLLVFGGIERLPSYIGGFTETTQSELQGRFTFINKLVDHPVTEAAPLLTARNLSGDFCAYGAIEADLVMPGDSITMRVFEDAATGVGRFERRDLSGTLAVGPGGEIAVPGIGRLMAAGRPLTCLEELVIVAFDTEMNFAATVTASFVARPPVLIQGTVNAPGSYDYSVGLTVGTLLVKAGAGGGMIDKNGYPFCRGRIFDHVEKDEGQYDDTTEIFWASGACLFIKAKSFHEFGGFDASYLAHMEEIDLCWRMKNSGKKIMYCGSSSVYHVGGGTLNYVNPQKTFLNFRNSLFTLYKNLDKGLFIKILTRLFLDSLAGAKFLFSGKIRHIGSILKAHFYFYKNISLLKAKRKQMTFKSFTGMKGMYTGNIIWQHFGRKKKTFKDL